MKDTDPTAGGAFVRDLEAVILRADRVFRMQVIVTLGTALLAGFLVFGLWRTEYQTITRDRDTAIRDRDVAIRDRDLAFAFCRGVKVTKDLEK